MYSESVFSYRQTLTQLSETLYITRSLVQQNVSDKVYGKVLADTWCPIDPIEAGAVFHEDALLDRPRFASAFKRVDILYKLNKILMYSTFGIWYVLCYWFPQYYFLLTHKKCTWAQATHVVIRTEEGAEYKTAFHKAKVCPIVAQQHDVWPFICQNCLMIIKCEAFDSKEVSNLNQSKKVYLSAMDSDSFCKCQKNNEYDVDENFEVMYIFEHKLVRYYLNFWSNCFEVAQFDSQFSPEYIHKNFCTGLMDESIRDSRKVIFGNIDYPTYPLWQMCLEEALEPFFVLQLASVALWIWDDYVPYALLVLAVMIITAIYDIRASKLHERRLFKLFKNIPDVNVFRFNSKLFKSVAASADIPMRGMNLYSNEDFLSINCSRISGKDILPGDVFELEPQMLVPCDAVVLCGGVIVIETNLSGESVPVVKHCLPLTESAEKDVDVHSTHAAESENFMSRSKINENFLTKKKQSLVFSEASDNENETNNDNVYKIDQDDVCTVFGSTTVLDIIKPDYGKRVLALAIRTSFLSRYGRLIRSLLFPMKTRFKFNSDAFRYLKYLFLYTLLGSTISVVRGAQFNFPQKLVLIRTLDLFTTSIPPALPAALSAGIIIVANRLRRFYKIRCWNLGRINLAGLVSTFVFDKTCTLTESNLDYIGVIDVENMKFEKKAPIKGRKNLYIDDDENKQPTLPSVTKTLSAPKVPVLMGNLKQDITRINNQFICAAATCHNAVVVNSLLIGDNLDLSTLRILKWSVHDLNQEALELYKLAKAINQAADTIELNQKLAFQSVRNLYGSGDLLPIILKPPNVTLSVMQLLRKGYSLATMKKTLESWDSISHSWKVNSPPETIELRQYFPNGFSELGIVKKYKFASALQRMCVIVRDPITQNLYSFVKGSPEIVADLCKSSTVPKNFYESVHQHTKNAAQVIAYAGKLLGKLNLKALKKITRREAESKMTLLGCFSFANKIKPEALPLLDNLTSAGCKCIVATGDHPLTSIAVAKEWGLIQKPLEESPYTSININNNTLCPIETSRNTSFDMKEIILGDFIERKMSKTKLKHIKDGFVWIKISQAAIPKNAENSHNDEVNLYKYLSLAQKPLLNSSKLLDTIVKRIIFTNNRKVITSDLRDFLQEKNPLDFEFVLTGRAFRKLRLLHEEMKLPWFEIGLNTPQNVKTEIMNKDTKASYSSLSSMSTETEYDKRLNKPGDCKVAVSEQKDFSHVIGRYKLKQQSLQLFLTSNLLPNLIQNSFFQEIETSEQSKIINRNSALLNVIDVFQKKLRNTRDNFLILNPETQNIMFFVKGEKIIKNAGSFVIPTARFPAKWNLCNLAAKFCPCAPNSKLLPLFNNLSSKETVNSYEQPFFNKNSASFLQETPQDNADKSKVTSEDESMILSVIVISKKSSSAYGDKLFSNGVYFSNRSKEKTTYELIQMSLFEFMLRNAKIYTRMSPEDKTSLITSLKNLPGNPVVGMCGDGANDYGALAAADVGVAVAKSQASLAASYHSKTINGCVDILRECRAALAIAVRVFQYIVLYSVIQYSSTTILYFYGMNYTDYQCLFVDFFIILPLTLSMMVTKSPKSIMKTTPNADLCAKSIAGRMILQTLWAVATQTVLVLWLPYFPNWIKFQVTPEAGDSSGPEIASYENTLLFLATNFQYVITCFFIVSNKGAEVNVRVNCITYFIMIILLIFNFLLMYYPRKSTVLFPTIKTPSPDYLPSPLNMNFMESFLIFCDHNLFIVNLPVVFKNVLLGITLAYFIVAFLIERIIVTYWENREISINNLKLKVHNGPIIKDYGTTAYHAL